MSLFACPPSVVTVRRVKTPAGAPDFTRGWLSRLAAKRPQKLDLAPGVRSEEPETRQKRAGYTLQMPVQTRGCKSPSTGPHAAELGFYFRGCLVMPME